MGLILGIIVCALTLPITPVMALFGPGADPNTGRNATVSALLTFCIGEAIGALFIVSHYHQIW
jgi:hypothetical protein